MRSQHKYSISCRCGFVLTLPFVIVLSFIFCYLCALIQRTRHPKRIILHGESIGGMVACHVARHMPVDVLVCDRTFSTLDATAARLMVSL